MNKRKGMSLIVLVITILVMIILAGVVIVSLSDNNPIKKASEAEFKNNVTEFKSQLQLYHTNGLGKDMSYVSTDANVLYKNSTGSTEVEKEKKHLAEMKKYIPNMTAKYSSKFDIVNGELVYRGTDPGEMGWNEEIGGKTAEKASFINGISGGTLETFYDVIKTSDGGYLAIGQTKSKKLGLGGGEPDFNNGDVIERILAVKYNASGKEVWRKGLGKSPWFQYGYKVAELTDGNYAIVGYGWLEDTDLYIGDYDYIGVKIDNSGNTIWEKGFGTLNSECPGSFGITATSDGGFVFTAGTYNEAARESKAQAIKVGKNGDVIVQKTYEDYDIISDITESSNVFCASADRKTGGMAVLELNKETLEIKEAHNIGSSGYGECIEKISDSEFLVTHSKIGTEIDIYKVNINTNEVKKIGNTIAKQSYKSYDITIAKDGNIVVGYNGIKFTKLDINTGNVIAQKLLANEASENVFSIVTSNDGGFVVVGTTKSKNLLGHEFILDTDKSGGAFIVKVNSDFVLEK